MIQANELRIGNYINDPELRIVDGEDIENIQDGNNFHKNGYEHFTHEFLGIELTDNWLKDFGFINPDSNDLFGGLLIPINHEYRLRLIKSFDIWTWEQNDKHLVLLQYVHQLQNLYFALNGEELTLKSLI